MFVGSGTPAPLSKTAAISLAFSLGVWPMLLPLFNPDLFWHLSAGRWMMERGIFPRADFLSFTKAQAPWINLEWGTHLLFLGAHAAGGMAGLWVLKVVLIALSALTLWKTVGLYGYADQGRCAALVVLSAGALAHADIRPDLISTLLFALLLYVLERHRLGRRRLELKHHAGLFALFAVWSNLHAGFGMGLMLLFFYAAAVFSGELARACVFAAAGSLMNPYGWQPYAVMAEHWGLRAELARSIQEWQPITRGRPFDGPFWPVLAALLVLLTIRWRQERRDGFPRGLAAAALFSAYQGFSHARLTAYFNVLAVPLIFFLCRDAPWLERPRLRIGALAAGAAYAAYLVWVLSFPAWGKFFDARFVPMRSAEFLAGEQEVFSGLRLYNPWEWGGYLGWRLHPWHKVFVDGRYLFHGLLGEMREAAVSPGQCREFLDKYRVDAALMRNSDTMLPDSSARGAARPWYVSYMPRSSWALVYWDSQAVLFVRRDRVPPKWLAAHEYRHVLPWDKEALVAALAGEISAKEAASAEVNRHRLERLLY